MSSRNMGGSTEEDLGKCLVRFHSSQKQIHQIHFIVAYPL